MPKSNSSKKWMQRHLNDPFVQRAQREGYRSRAVYKLLEIQQKDKLIRSGMTVVELGAAPGGWSQVLAELVGDKGMVIASDILPVDPLPGVTFIQGDFTEDGVYQQLLTALDGRRVDAVVSDMAPNISGIKVADQAKAMYLAELTLDFAQQTLRQGGALLVKVFMGEGFDAYLKTLRACFKTVKSRKPEASRASSTEVYLLATGYSGSPS